MCVARKEECVSLKRVTETHSHTYTLQIQHTCGLDRKQHRVHWVVVEATRDALDGAVCAHIPDSSGTVFGAADDQVSASAAFVAGIQTQHSLLVPS